MLRPAVTAAARGGSFQCPGIRSPCRERSIRRHCRRSRAAVRRACRPRVSARCPLKDRRTIGRARCCRGRCLGAAGRSTGDGSREYEQRTRRRSCRLQPSRDRRRRGPVRPVSMVGRRRCRWDVGCRDGGLGDRQIARYPPPAEQPAVTDPIVERAPADKPGHDQAIKDSPREVAGQRASDGLVRGERSTRQPKRIPRWPKRSRHLLRRPRHPWKEIAWWPRPSLRTSIRWDR